MPPLRFSVFAVAAAHLLTLSWANILGASATCDAVETSTNIQVERPLDAAYTLEQGEYWSTGCALLKPSCIMYPTTAAEVAAIVSILNTNDETFAVKSGGHNPNQYWASVEGGPLISTAHFNQVILNPTTGTVRVRPGNRWDEVAAALDGTGWSVVGGRLGNVGVGGYLLGGGLSFMSTEYGWAANSILEYELVLANATVVYVTASSHPDLFLSLKGGGNIFGIVTSFLVQAYQQGDVWGGNVFWNATPSTNTALLSAIRNFSSNYPDDKAGIIVTAERGGAGVVDIWTGFFYYNGPTPPAGVFDEFLAIPGYLNTLQTQQSYSALLSANNAFVIRGQIYGIGTETMPVPSSANLDVLEAVHAYWRSTAATALLVPGEIGSIAYQPLPKSMAALARSKGGDLLDYDDDVDRIVIELNYSHLLPVNQAFMDQVMVQTYSGFRDLVVAFTENGKLPEAELPLFLNDVYFRQDYWGRLKPARAQTARQVQAQVDPGRLFTDRTGGLKP